MTEQRRLQLVELEILKYVDSFCRKHNIKYSLYGGTLLGAFRHKGFIPWDDDLDICMLRSEYERFLSLWQKECHSDYAVQNKETDSDFTQSFSKVRKNGTLFIQESDLGKKYNKGIFIDVFPIDRIPNGFKRIVFKVAVMLYQLCCREYVPPRTKSTRLQRLFSRLFLKCTNCKMRVGLRNSLLSWIKRFEGCSSLGLVSIETLPTLGFIYPPDSAEHFVNVDFEDGSFPVWENGKTALSIRYGDYTILPPESARTWTHRPISLSFGKDES